MNCYFDTNIVDPKNSSDLNERYVQRGLQGKYLIYMYYNIFVKYFSGEYSIVDPSDIHSVYSNFRGKSFDADDQGYNEQIVIDKDGSMKRLIFNVKNIRKPEKSFFEAILTNDELLEVYKNVGTQIRPFVEADIFVYFWLYKNTHYN